MSTQYYHPKIPAKVTHGFLLLLMTCISLLYSTDTTSADQRLSKKQLPKTIDVFYQTRMFITGLNSLQSQRAVNDPIQIRLHDLDALNLLQAKVSARLSTEQTIAKAQAIDWLQHNPNERTQLKNAWTSQFKAKQFGLAQVPAMVFNEQEIVYGHSDVITAISIWQRQQGKQ